MTVLDGDDFLREPSHKLSNFFEELVNYQEDMLRSHREKFNYSDADAQRYKRRYVSMLPLYLSIFFLFVLGSWVVIPFALPQEFACELSKIEWFKDLWRSNHQYEEVLSINSIFFTTTRINLCRLITGCSWGAALGMVVFVGRMLIELIYWEKKLIAGFSKLTRFIVLAVLLLLTLSGIGWLPYSDGMTLSTSKDFQLYSLSVFSNPIKVYIFLSFYSFFCFVFLSEIVSLIMIAIRDSIYTRKQI